MKLGSSSMIWDEPGLQPKRVSTFLLVVSARERLEIKLTMMAGLDLHISTGTAVHITPRLAIGKDHLSATHPRERPNQPTQPASRR